MESGAALALRYFFPAHFSMRRSRLGQPTFHTNITLHKLHILNTFENDFRHDDIIQNKLLKDDDQLINIHSRHDS